MFQILFILLLISFKVYLNIMYNKLLAAEAESTNTAIGKFPD